MPHFPQGFTLIEAMVAVAIAGALACIAVPAWINASEAAHSASAQVAIGASILRAANHSAVTGTEVVLCPGDASGCRAGIDWSRGWIVYADLDRDRFRDANETLLTASGALGGRAHLRSTEGRTRLMFQPNGGNVGSNVTFTLCDGRGAGKATSLVLANNGRLRAAPATPAAALACVASI